MGEVVEIRSRYDALKWGGGWEKRAQHLEEYALTLELIVATYKLQLRVAEREIERLRGLIE